MSALVFSAFGKLMPQASLKQFARTDGLLRGTALSSNLITTACLSTLPGFGPAGLLVSNTIQMLISGVAEIPTGRLADRYGWIKSVKIGLVLKFLVTLSFLAATLFACRSMPGWTWTFITVEALVDSLASAFLSGAYQAAYLAWYRKQAIGQGLDPSKTPPLFLSCLRYALKVRLLLPLCALALVTGLHLFMGRKGVLESYYVAYLLIGFIFLLRTLVFLRVFRDLGAVTNQTAPNANKEAPVGGVALLTRVTGSPYFAAYSSAAAVSMFAVFFLIPQAFKLFQSTGMLVTQVWACGLLFGIGIYLLRTLVAVILFPRLEKRNASQTVGVLLIFLGCALLMGGAAIVLKPGFWGEFSILLVLSILSTTCSDGIQSIVDSRLDEETDPSHRATWLSIATATGMLFFGIISSQILMLGVVHLAVGIFCIAFSLACVFSAVRLWQFDYEIPLLPSFSSVMGRLLVKSTIVLVVAFACCDIINFSLTAFQIQRHNEQTVSKLVWNAVEEPLVQGSFVEASRRLQRFKNDQSFLCAKLNAWDFSSDLCGKSAINPRFSEEVTQKIHLSGSSSEDIGTIRIYFDRTPIFSAILSRFIFSLFFFVSCALGLFIVFRRLGVRIQKELDQVVRLVDVETSKVNFGHDTNITVQEFSLIGARLKELVRLRVEMSRQHAITLLAQQVSHDIRSPMMALKIVMQSNPTLPEPHRALINQSLDRMEEIADTLLTESRNELDSPEFLAREDISPLSYDPEPFQSMSDIELNQILDDLVSEHRLQISDAEAISIDRLYEKGPSRSYTRLGKAQFKRVLSNLIKNATESLGGCGKVIVSLKVGPADSIRVVIADNGKGIPKAVLNRLGARGLSFGKARGNGLGIWHAKKAIDSWGGVLGISSEEGEGTKVEMTLKAQPFLPV